MNLIAVAPSVTKISVISVYNYLTIWSHKQRIWGEWPSCTVECLILCCSLIINIVLILIYLDEILYFVQIVSYLGDIFAASFLQKSWWKIINTKIRWIKHTNYINITLPPCSRSLCLTTHIPTSKQIRFLSDDRGSQRSVHNHL